MSEIQTRQNIDELEAVPFRAASSVFAASDVLRSLTSITSSVVKDLITGSVDIKTTQFNASASQMNVRSPNSLRLDFSELYAANLDALNSDCLDTLSKQKAAVAKTISELSYQIVNKAAVEEKLVQLINADSKTFKKATEVAMNEIQAQHSQVFISELQHIVAQASAEAGFKTVNVAIKNSVPVITAVNDFGQGIVSEIRSDNKTKVLDLVSETIGITDGSCKDVIQQFSASLDKYGVKFSKLNRKWTGGNCWLPTAKEAEKGIKQSREKKLLDRRRTLNKKSKQKN